MWLGARASAEERSGVLALGTRYAAQRGAQVRTQRLRTSGYTITVL